MAGIITSRRDVIVAAVVVSAKHQSPATRLNCRHWHRKRHAVPTAAAAVPPLTRPSHCVKLCSHCRQHACLSILDVRCASSKPASQPADYQSAAQLFRRTGPSVDHLLEQSTWQLIVRLNLGELDEISVKTGM